MALTLDQSKALLEGERNMKRMDAADYRHRAEEYKRAANEGVDYDLRRIQFEESSRLFALAREADRQAEAIDTVLAAAKP